MSREFVTIDCCPVDKRLYDELKAIKDATGCVYQSIYRGQDPGAQRYLTGGPPCFKHSQAYLYAHQNDPGFNPANPPGFSTHEERNDGVAYPVARGAVLEYWQVGIDLDDPHVSAFIADARKRGWIASITYPGSSSEYHHVNFRKEPELDLTLKLGDKGPEVGEMTKELAWIHTRSDPAHTYLATAGNEFTRLVKDAVKDFQGEHHLVADGIAGPHTLTQLKVAYRNEQRSQQIAELKAKLANVEKQLASARATEPRDEKAIKALAERASKLRHEIADLGGNPGGPA